MSKDVNIVISGCSGSGKTALLHFIGEALCNSGFIVSATDEGETVDTFRFFPIQASDNRSISISTAIPPNNINSIDN
jgi:nucleoside-triphosphatase THEP1